MCINVVVLQKRNILGPIFDTKKIKISNELMRQIWWHCETCCMTNGTTLRQWNKNLLNVSTWKVYDYLTQNLYITLGPSQITKKKHSIVKCCLYNTRKRLSSEFLSSLHHTLTSCKDRCNAMIEHPINYKYTWVRYNYTHYHEAK